jgi:hypothetical protein
MRSLFARPLERLMVSPGSGGRRWRVLAPCFVPCVAGGLASAGDAGGRQYSAYSDTKKPVISSTPRWRTCAGFGRRSASTIGRPRRPSLSCAPRTSGSRAHQRGGTPEHLRQLMAVGQEPRHVEGPAALRARGASGLLQQLQTGRGRVRRGGAQPRRRGPDARAAVRRLGLDRYQNAWVAVWFPRVRRRRVP